MNGVLLSAVQPLLPAASTGRAMSAIRRRRRSSTGCRRWPSRRWPRTTRCGVEEAARQSVALADKVGAFSDWCGTLRKIEGNAQTVAVTIEIGPQVSLYAFNDWALAFAGTVTDLFSTRSRRTPPPGLSDPAIAALKTLRLGERVTLSGRMGEIAGSGVFDLSRLFGKSDAEHRQFLQTPRFVARIEALAASKKN